MSQIVYIAPELPEERLYFRDRRWFIANGTRPPFYFVEIPETTARAWIAAHLGS